MVVKIESLFVFNLKSLKQRNFDIDRFYKAKMETKITKILSWVCPSNKLSDWWLSRVALQVVKVKGICKLIKCYVIIPNIITNCYFLPMVIVWFLYFSTHIRLRNRNEPLLKRQDLRSCKSTIGKNNNCQFNLFVWFLFSVNEKI